MSMIAWNKRLKLALSDVDETIADVYQLAEPAMIAELSGFLQAGGKLFLVTGGGLSRVTAGITDLLDARWRQNILISHCSGAEVWGFTEEGALRGQPFYSIYKETFTPELKQCWRAATQKLVAEFGLRPHDAQPILQFKQRYSDPLDIIYDDRGPQITLEFVNAYDLTAEQVSDMPDARGSRDLRIPVLERAEQLFAEAGVPITPRLGGTFALDLAIEGVSKTTSIQRILNDEAALATIGLQPRDLQDPSVLEVWGDKFSVVRGGTDRHMAAALPREVRCIDFRLEDPAEFEPGSHIVIWDGAYHLHHGLLEHLRSRHSTTL